MITHMLTLSVIVYRQAPRCTLAGRRGLFTLLPAAFLPAAKRGL